MVTFSMLPRLPLQADDPPQLPGSGKSWFPRVVLARLPALVDRIVYYCHSDNSGAVRRYPLLMSWQN